MKIIFIRDAFGYYEIENMLKNNFDNLADFFACEVGGGSIETWINFLNDNKIKSIAGNQMFLEKKDGKVYIYYEQLDDDTLVDNDPFIMDINKLIALLNTWENFIKSNAKKILLESKDKQIQMLYDN